MKYYKEPARQIPVVSEVDVLVAGAGPAGFAAAANAGRLGARTMIIEQQGSFGGIATSGLMSHWTGTVDSKFYRELIQCSREGSQPNLINPEILKTRMQEILAESGVQPLLYTFVSSAICKNNKAAGVITESKSGRQAVMAKVIIDATGDGDVAAKAGASYVKGRETDSKMQPMTLMFKLGGVDTDRAIYPGSFETKVNVPKGEIQALAKEHLPFPAGHVLLYRSTLPGIVTVNMTNCISVDGTDARDLTKAEFTCRSQIEPIVRFLREYAPGYEQCYPISSASLIGVRETRHFEGVYTLTETDILEARKFDDWVVKGAHFNFDVHNLSGSGLDETGAQAEFRQNKGYTIPYGCLLPKVVDGLLLAGRCISGTHIAHSNYRVMPICLAMGEAAGIAAALAAHGGIEPRHVNPRDIQSVLL